MSKKISQWVVVNFVLLILFLTPLLQFGFNLGFEQIKVIFFLGGVGGLTIAWLLSDYVNNFKLTKVKLLAGLFIVCLGLSTYGGFDSQASLFGDYPYFQGLILYISLVLFFLIVSTVPIQLKTVAIVLLISSLVISILAIRDFILLTLFYQPVLNYAGRVVSTFGQPNLYAGFLVMALPFSYLLNQSLKKSQEKIVVGGGMLLAIMAILISQSRDSIFILVLLIVGLTVLKAYPLRQRIWQNKLTLVLTGGLIFLGIFLSLSLFFKIIKQEIISPTSNQWLLEQSPEKRIYIWRVANGVIWQKPLLGYGLENFDLAFASYFKGLNFNNLNDPVAHSLKNLTVNRAHSYPLDIAVFSGILGLVSWLSLFVLLFKKSSTGFLRLCLVIFLIWSSVQIPSVVQLIYFWLIAGLIEKSSLE